MAQTTPSDTTGLPNGIPYIIANEAAERFSFYGMKAALAIFLANYLGVMGGESLSESQATSWVSYFTGAVYLTPLFGALIADSFAGKYKTIIILSIVYCLGHLSLAFMGVGGVVQAWLLTGLGLIALGAGGIKPCVSAHVGDQFGKNNKHLLPKIFNTFYFSINAGAVISNLAIPLILKWYGPHLAFGIPGALMAIATLFFFMGRNKFVHIPAEGQSFFKEVISPAGLKTIFKLIPLYLFVAMFWCLFDQTATTLVFQAENMNLNLLGITVLPSQIQAFNPFLILILIPLFTYVIYPAVGKVIKLTPLRKIGAGLFLTALSFVVIAMAQEAIDRGETPTVAWQLLAYFIFTTAEIMISIVCLEFSYTQAMPRMKSLIMSIFLLSVFAGNMITGVINDIIRIPSTKLTEKTETVYANELSAHKFQSDLLVQSIEEIKTLPNTINTKDRDLSIYTLIHAKKARLASPGPDGKLFTPDDLNTYLLINDIEENEKNTWLYKEKLRLGMIEENKTAQLVTIEQSIGGGSKLEGASYFWFFTKLMFITAILFIPYSLLYKEKSYLQGDNDAPQTPA